MLPTFLMDSRVQLVGAAEPRKAARKKFEEDLKAPAYETVSELLAHPDRFDAVYIASPHQFHCEHVCAVARLDKAVLVEKPLALSIEECDQMVETCKKNNVPLVVGHCHSFDAPYRMTRKLIRDGAYGRVRTVLAINYTDYLYRPRRPEELDTNKGGGAFYSQAAHQVDIVRLLVGEEPSWVHSVSGSWDSGRPTEGAYTALMGFPSGAYASLVYSGYGHFDTDEWMSWIGEMGQRRTPDVEYGRSRAVLSTLNTSSAEAEFKSARTFGGRLYDMPDITKKPLAYQHFGPIVVTCDHADIRPLPNKIIVYEDSRRVEHELGAPTHPRVEVIDELYEVLFENKTPVHDGVWARETVRVISAMLESSRSGGSVNLI